MFNKKITLFFICFSLILISGYFVLINKSYIKYKIKNALSLISIYSQNYQNLKEINKNLKIDLNQTNLDTINIVKEFGYIPFYFQNEKIFSIQNTNYIFNTFSTKVLTHDKSNDWPEYGTSYIDFYDNKIFLVSGSGIISFVNYDNTLKKKINFNLINSNIHKLIKYPEFIATRSSWGIKDILIKNNKIYLSHSNRVSKDCSNVQVLVSNLNYEYLDFELFFEQNNCIEAPDGYQAGGTLVDYGKNKVLIGFGDYQNFKDVRLKPDYLLGKIILVDEITKNFKIISQGHRNPQGIVFLEDKNIIINTEHGPQGGDEININKLENNELIPDYGWPISSYGEHYGYDGFDPNSEEYKIAPLHKSHKEYGFIEPIKYFVPSIAISKIIRIGKNTFLIGSMGNDIDEGDMSLHQVTFDDKFNKIIDHKVIPVYERIRDMIYIQDYNKIIIFGTSNKSLIFLDINEK